MGIISQMPSMTPLIARSKTLAPVVAAFASAALSFTLLGDKWLIGFWLFCSGYMLNDVLNTSGPASDPVNGPGIPWDERYSGERFAYFLPATVPCVLASLLLVATTRWGNSYNWLTIVPSALLLGVGIYTAFRLWNARYD